jgi:hypothetical protein
VGQFALNFYGEKSSADTSASMPTDVQASHSRPAPCSGVTLFPFVPMNRRISRHTAGAEFEGDAAYPQAVHPANLDASIP